MAELGFEHFMGTLVRLSKTEVKTAAEASSVLAKSSEAFIESSEGLDRGLSNVLKRAEFSVDPISKTLEINNVALKEIVETFERGKFLKAFELIHSDTSKIIKSNKNLSKLFELHIQKWPRYQLRQIRENAELLEKSLPEVAGKFDAAECDKTLRARRPETVKKILNFLNENKKTIAFAGVGFAGAVTTLASVSNVQKALSGCIVYQTRGDGFEICKNVDLTCDQHLKYVDEGYIKKCNFSLASENFTEPPCEPNDLRSCANCALKDDKRGDGGNASSFFHTHYECKKTTFSEALAHLAHNKFNDLLDIVGNVTHPILHVLQIIGYAFLGVFVVIIAFYMMK